MKPSIVLTALIIMTGISLTAQADEKFKLKITNGSNMPIAPGVVYTSGNSQAEAFVGGTASMGLVQLCQTGNPAGRDIELRANHRISDPMKTSGPIMPGQSLEMIISLNPNTQNIHFEAMYGKTKDVCSVVSISGQALQGLRSGTTHSFIQKDETLATGAFLDPSVSTENGVMNCAQAGGAVDCLRELAGPQMAPTAIHYFSGYLPSVVSFIENRYGAKETQSLLIPTSGAVTVGVTRD